MAPWSFQSVSTQVHSSPLAGCVILLPLPQQVFISYPSPRIKTHCATAGRDVLTQGNKRTIHLPTVLASEGDLKGKQTGLRVGGGGTLHTSFPRRHTKTRPSAHEGGREGRPPRCAQSSHTYGRKAMQSPPRFTCQATEGRGQFKDQCSRQ